MFKLIGLLTASIGLTIATACAQAADIHWRSIQETRAGVFQMKSVFPVIKDAKPPAAALSREAERMAKTDTADFRKTAIEAHKDRQYFTGPYVLDSKVSLSIVHDDLASGYLERYEFSGGAHGNTSFHPLNYGVRNGKSVRLKLTDLLAPGVRAADVLEEIVRPELNRIKLSQELEPVDSIDAGLADRFVITPAGITWLFAPYEVGPYSDGSFFVKISWEKLAGSIDSNGPLKPLLVQKAR